MNGFKNTFLPIDSLKSRDVYFYATYKCIQSQPGPLLLAWINNYIHCKVWDEIPYPFVGKMVHNCFWQWRYTNFIFVCIRTVHSSTPIADDVPLTKLYLTHWGQDKMAAVSQTTLSNAFSWIEILEYRLRFHWSLFLRVQLTIIQYWFR